MLWEGFIVPIDPKREWGEWMCSETPCPRTPAGIKCGYGKTVTCAECIYSRYNYEARRCFYEQYYGKWPALEKSKHPKLTVEVFNRPDCPDWAEWAAVDASGEAYWFECQPEAHFLSWIFGQEQQHVGGCYDSSDWQNSLIQRHHNELPKLTAEVFNRPDCPEWARWAAVDANGTGYLYSMEPWIGQAGRWLVSITGDSKGCGEFDASDWQNSLIKRPHKKELPKLTAEVFNRPDCPKWAQWAAVNWDGRVFFYSDKPMMCRSAFGKLTGKTQLLIEETFDALDWEDSLVQRPSKELPKLTQTAFHSPDCPKGATTLKVFPANHVVALDKDDKVLGVMELQCKEGEINRFEADWYYDYKTHQLYYDPDQCCLPATAEPAKVTFLPAEELVGKAVTDQLTGKTVLITHVGDGKVYKVGVMGTDIISMVTLVTRYRFTSNGGFCCVVDTHDIN